VVFSLQSVLNLDFVIGGLTALEMQGLSHYLSLSENKIVHLFGNDVLPEWVKNLDLNVKFVRHTTNSLFGEKYSGESLPLRGGDHTRPNSLYGRTTSSRDSSIM
jgi:hypothetical protein